jgi:hypothetical protein
MCTFYILVFRLKKKHSKVFFINQDILKTALMRFLVHFGSFPKQFLSHWWRIVLQLVTLIVLYRMCKDES